MVDSGNQAASLADVTDTGNLSSIPRGLRCIAVSSGKGGVGKTVISIGLAYGLASKGYRVLLLDGDVGLANVDLQMGIDPEITLLDVVFGDAELADAIVHMPNGPDVISSACCAPEMVDMGNLRRQMFVDELIRFAGDYDFFISDVAAGIGKSVTTFLATVPEVLVVVANEPTSIMDAYSVIKVLSLQDKPPSMSIIVNMVRSLEEGEILAGRLEGIVKRFLAAEINLGGIVVYDEAVRNAVQMRRPVMEYSPSSAAAKCIQEIADYIASGKNLANASTRPGETFFNTLAKVGLNRYMSETSPGASS